MNKPKLHKVLAGSGGNTTIRKDLDSIKQCDWVRRNGTDGYLCCVEARDHEGPHHDHTDAHYRAMARACGEKYVEPQTWWYPLKEWERNFGEAARACYSSPHQWEGSR